METNTKWKWQWKCWVRPTRQPGVWKRKEGGCLVRARVTHPTTGHLVEIRKVLHDCDELAALRWLTEEKSRIQAGVVSAVPPAMRFCEFAKSLFDEKVKLREIRSARGRQKWKTVLDHLIGGTKGEKAKKSVEGFGEMFIDKIRVSHVEAWKLAMADLVAAEDYAPTTLNGWLAILRVIMKAAKRKFDLPRLATDGVKDFDVSEHETYSEEEPNTLLPEEVPAFLTTMRELYPQHYAMVFLGLATGLRPSSLRPLRRAGEMADILWNENKLLVRRSHSLGTEVMNTTKQRVKYKIHLPQEVVDVLQWHVDTQLVTPEQKESDLLFPATNGGFRSPSVLNKPFDDVAQAIGLRKQLTQRGLRRTFNDLARAAEVEAIVTRSISGHLTERMQHHYSTVNPTEQRASISKVVDIATKRTVGGAPTGAPPTEVVPPNEKAG